MDANRKNAIRTAIAADGLTTRFGAITNLEPIGEGGNGLVYGGTLLKHRVAVKLLVDALREKLARFRAEYLHIRTLPAHPGIVRLIHYEEIDSAAGAVPAIVMSRYGGSLKGRAAASYADVLALFRFLVDTLAFLHQNGVIHRDLKPENILVEGSAFALTDFGIASYNPEIFGPQDFKTGKRDILGNRAFSAPEQAYGAPPHAAMDLYALGQLCQWYVFGSPHHGTQRRRITARFAEAEPLDAIIDRCLSHDPRRRFESAGEVWETFQTLSAPRRLQDAWACLHRFAQVLSETFPRTSSGQVSTIDVKIIQRFFEALERRNTPSFAFWFDGRATNHIDDLKPLGGGIWLVDGMEIEPAQLWVNRHPGEHGDFALLLLAARPSFNVYSRASDYEEVGLVDDKTYITRPEVDNGFAEIDGAVVPLRDRLVEVRSRHTVAKAIFIATKYHDAARPANDDATRRIAQTAASGWLTDLSLATYADEIVKHIHPDVMPGL